MVGAHFTATPAACNVSALRRLFSPPPTGFFSIRNADIDPTVGCLGQRRHDFGMAEHVNLEANRVLGIADEVEDGLSAVVGKH